MRDIMLQYCGVRARAHEECSFAVVDAVHMADTKSYVEFLLFLSFLEVITLRIIPESRRVFKANTFLP